MSLSDQQGRYFPYLGGCLCLAGIVHIVSILAMPYLASNDAYARLALVSAPNQLTLLPKPEPGTEMLPFNDPAFALAVCRYDIQMAPFRLSANVGNESLLSLSFHDRYGRVYYSFTDRAAVRGRIETVVLTAAQKEALEAEDSDEGTTPDLRLVTDHTQGFVLLRWLADQPGELPRAQRLVQDISCALDQE